MVERGEARAFWQRETLAWRRQWRLAGVDEVGRGPLAGPVVAAAVILPAGVSYPTLDDSKVVPPRERARLLRHMQADGARIGLGAVGPAGIDRLNIYQATRLAMWRALAALPGAPDWVVVDAMAIAAPVPVEALVGGDGRCASVAAASVVAKVLRDRCMTALDARFPGYGFAQHKGYATAQHKEALVRWGPCPAHRRSFLTGGAFAEPSADGHDEKGPLL
jgi:ribonuclease HII